MTNASVSEAKARLSALLDRVKSGETVTITDRGRPVARIVPLDVVGDVDWDARLELLEREGLVRRPETPFDVEAFLALPKPQFEGSAVDALLEERREDTR
jgi:prevent-host-death family protein